ncbi:Zn-dependent hydrolase [Psychromonas sp. 14N.309.X.WAT.B.A12]|uniref:Zn-dependent hydrolase n=1 Tax=Psychromonas sp. 14N.309.X.WAT.B.A12 TaxID=2998322 RepID=UPI0025B1C2A4|nr:Zn-dependent hydrolase [Psychromonas sp. 14N.309.X.WAT.B.A12]MDN2664124.1 Zn-dependent hydrolase [Psychromonas sp. 14N.309.X.WAT.B.A12]
MAQIQIKPERLLSFITEMANIGGTPNGGCNRQALTEEDRIGRTLFLNWCSEIGGVARLDSMGNIFVHFKGTDTTKLPVLMGSHLDTQPSGGKFDGVYGVLAALEVMSSLHDQNITLTHPVEIVVWSNEEGSRFSPAMSGSGVFAGKLSQSTLYQSVDDQGVSYQQALITTEQLGEFPCQSFPFAAALELHIEQGPILEAEQKSIGIVTGVQGMNWYQVTISGETTHAGPTPMSMRKDPVQGLHAMLPSLYAKVAEYGEQARITIGKITTIPSSPNTVPEQVIFTLDLRHPEQSILDKMSEELLSLCQQVPSILGSQVDVLWQSPAVVFDARCIDVVTQAAEQLSLTAMPIVSGAGHDSVYLSTVGPTGMIFVPCKDGISHNEKEHVEPEHLIAGGNVLLHSLMQLAQ